MRVVLTFLIVLAISVSEIAVAKPAVKPGYTEDVITTKRSLWGVADDYLETARRGKLPGFSKADLEDLYTRRLRREEILEALVLYNQAISPTFATIRISDEYDNIPKGTVVTTPPTKILLAYILNVRKAGEDDDAAARKAAAAPTPTPKPGQARIAGRLYADASLDSVGKQRFSKASTPAIIVVKGSSIRGMHKRAATRWIILHSTATPTSQSTNTVLEGIQRKRTAHFLVGRSGAIYAIFPDNVAINHAGDIRSRRLGALWNGEGHVSLLSIGIEVEADGGHEWNAAQYAAVRTLVAYLGGKYGLRKCDVLAHSQVAYTPKFKTRGRKSDPYGVNWGLLGLPRNSSLLDWDVIRGTARANLDEIHGERNWKRRGARTQQRDDSLDGLIASERLARTR